MKKSLMLTLHYTSVCMSVMTGSESAPLPAPVSFTGLPAVLMPLT